MRKEGQRPGFLVCAIACALSGCGSSDRDEDGKRISLGAVIDQTGSAGPASWAESARLAASQMNEALSREGSPIRFDLVIKDSSNVPVIAAESAEALVRIEAAKGLVVDTSQDTLEVLKLQYDDDDSKHLGVPIVGMVATSPLFNNTSAEHPDALAQKAYRDTEGWHFRTITSSTVQGVVLAQIIEGYGDVNGDGQLKASIFASNEPFGLGQISALTKALDTQGTQVILERILFDPAEHTTNELEFFADAVAQLTDGQTDGADDGEPDLLLGFTFPGHLAAIIQAYQQADSEIRFVHGVALRNQMILDSLGSDANGQEGVSYVVVAPDESGENFARDIQGVTHMPPNSMDGSAYDATAILLLASLIAAQASSDPSAITGAQVRDTIARTSETGGEIVRPGLDGFERAVRLIQNGEPINYEGAQGPCDFDDYGNSATQLVRFAIENGVFEDKEIYDCVSTANCLSQ